MTEHAVPAPDLLRLDALERHGEPFAPRLALEVDADVEGVDAAHDYPETVAALDDVGIDEAATCDLGAERQRLLVRLAPAEDGLEAADELNPSARLLSRRESGRRARKPERRHRASQPCPQADQHDKASDPHGAQSYQTPETPVALLTNPLDPLHSPFLPAAADAG